VPLTVHDYSRSANLYVNFTQNVPHDRTPTNLTAPNQEHIFRIFSSLSTPW